MTKSVGSSGQEPIQPNPGGHRFPRFFLCGNDNAAVIIIP